MKKLVIEFALVLIVIILGSFWWGHELEKNNFLQENQESLRVGVIFANSMQDGGWNQQQYDAFQGLQQELGLQLFYRENEPYADDWLHFESSDEDLDFFFQNLDIPYSNAITLSATLEISTLFQDLDMEFHKRGQHHDLIMDLKLKSMFYKFSDIYHEETLASGQLNQFRQRFNELRGHIYHSNNAVQIQSVDLLAAQMHLSTSYFQHIYKALFGVSVLHDVITARIEYAGYLMQNSGDPINRIAAACGYDNIEHFTRQFRKLKGYSPRQYQKLARQTEKEY